MSTYISPLAGTGLRVTARQTPRGCERGTLPSGSGPHRKEEQEGAWPLLLVIRGMSETSTAPPESAVRVEEGQMVMSEVLMASVAPISHVLLCIQHPCIVTHSQLSPFMPVDLLRPAERIGHQSPWQKGSGGLTFCSAIEDSK